MGKSPLLESSPLSLIGIEPDGWLFEYEVEYNGKRRKKRIKLFSDIRGMDANLELAGRLGISPDEAWKLKEEALKAWWPKSLREVRNLFPMIEKEDENIMLAILSFFSLKLRDPDERVMGVLIESNNSAGKSYFAKNLLKPLRSLENGQMVIELTRLTGPFIERKLKDQNVERRIIYLQETKDAPPQLHIVLSEGKLVVGLVEREGGQFVAREIKAEGHPFLLATTVNWQGSPDLIHRCIYMNLDESEEQTRRIMHFITKKESDKTYEDRLKQFAEGCAKIFKELWEKTPENVEVVVPYLPLIEKQLIKRPLDIKMRRDWSKLIALLKGSAILFHKYRPKLKKEEGPITRIMIVSTLDDLREVLPLFEKGFKQTLTGLSEKEEKVLKALEEFNNNNDGFGYATYRELFKLTGIPTPTLRLQVIPRLEAKGYVIIDREARPHRIERARGLERLGINVKELEKMANRLIELCITKHELDGWKRTEEIADLKAPEEVAA